MPYLTKNRFTFRALETTTEWAEKTYARARVPDQPAGRRATGASCSSPASSAARASSAPSSCRSRRCSRARRRPSEIRRHPPARIVCAAGARRRWRRARGAARRTRCTWSATAAAKGLRARRRLRRRDHRRRRRGVARLLGDAGPGRAGADHDRASRGADLRARRRHPRPRAGHRVRSQLRDQDRDLRRHRSRSRSRCACAADAPRHRRDAARRGRLTRPARTGCACRPQTVDAGGAGATWQGRDDPRSGDRSAAGCFDAVASFRASASAKPSADCQRPSKSAAIRRPPSRSPIPDPRSPVSLRRRRRLVGGVPLARDLDGRAVAADAVRVSDGADHRLLLHEARGADARRARRARRALYGLGIVLTFTVFGSVLAAVAGAAGLNRFAANPWVNLGDHRAVPRSSR